MMMASDLVSKGARCESSQFCAVQDGTFKTDGDRMYLFRDAIGRHQIPHQDKGNAAGRQFWTIGLGPEPTTRFPKFDMQSSAPFKPMRKADVSEDYVLTGDRYTNVDANTVFAWDGLQAHAGTQVAESLSNYVRVFLVVRPWRRSDPNAYLYPSLQTRTVEVVGAAVRDWSPMLQDNVRRSGRRRTKVSR